MAGSAGAYVTARNTQYNTKYIVSTSIDLSGTAGDTNTFTIPAGWEGFVDINSSFLHVTEGIGAADTNAVVDISVTASGGSAEVLGRYNSDGVSANTMALFTVQTGYEDGRNLIATDKILIDHTTKASGSSTAGAVTVYLAVALRPLAR